jgi:hypothetical protein
VWQTAAGFFDKAYGPAGALPASPSPPRPERVTTFDGNLDKKLVGGDTGRPRAPPSG